MIDIHSHIIPNFDDGCKNINESLEIIKSAKLNGIDTIFATPHYKYGVYDSKSSDVASAVSSINKVLEMSNINIKVYPGHEIMLSPDIIDLLKDSKLVTLNSSKYVLIEFNMTIKPHGISHTINNLLVAGYIPIIAHPERYEYFKKDVKSAIRYVEAGALFQMDIGSILGHYGKGAKDTLIKLLKHNLIHLWGSDVHSGRNVYPELNDCFKKINKIISKEMFEDIVYNNPLKVVRNEDIEIFDIKQKIGLFN